MAKSTDIQKVKSAAPAKAQGKKAPSQVVGATDKDLDSLVGPPPTEETPTATQIQPADPAPLAKAQPAPIAPVAEAVRIYKLGWDAKEKEVQAQQQRAQEQAQAAAQPGAGADAQTFLAQVQQATGGVSDTFLKQALSDIYGTSAKPDLGTADGAVAPAEAEKASTNT